MQKPIIKPIVTGDIRYLLHQIHIPPIVTHKKTVAKTSVIRQYVDNSFTKKYKSTIGMDFLTKEVVVEGKQYSLQIWDTAGKKGFQQCKQYSLKKQVYTL